MTTKQNAIDLANTARSEAANTAKRTIAVIIANWNECVKQAGFTGVFDFPTTGYSRKSQLIADLERCAAQLDDYVEPSKYMDTTTAKQYAADMNAILSGSLTADHEAQIDFFAANDHSARRELIEVAHAEALEMNEETDRRRADSIRRKLLRIAEERGVLPDLLEKCHAEALEINDAYNTLYVYAPGDAARDVWPQLTEIERAVSIEFAHKQALHENQQHDDAIAYFARKGSNLCIEAFSKYQLKQMSDFSHAEALDINSTFRECA